MNSAWLKPAISSLMLIGLTSCGGGKADSPVASGGGTPPPVVVDYTITATAGANGRVTPSGVTNVAQGASQSYTITPNSSYAVEKLVVDGVVTTSTTHTFANVRGNHTISATFSAAPAGGIALSLVPARTTGVAPLAVFFDASGTTDVGVTTRPFHDLEYTWDFGDPVVGTEGTWAYGAQPGVSSKNSTIGPVAAHVFEKSGIYTVTLTAFDGTNTVTTSKTITVDDPEVVFAGTKTVCVSTSGTFTGCPAGAAHATNTSDFATALGNLSSTVKRLLLRTDETWTTTARVQISQAGPGYVGSYGAGAKPIVSYGSGSNYSILAFEADDWRVVDIAIAAGNLVNGVNAFQNDARTQITLLRDDVTGSNGSFDTSSVNKLGDTISDQFTVQDCTSIGIPGTVGTVNSWVYGQRFSFQGNFMDNQGTAIYGGEHVMRFPKVIKGVISNNTPRNPGPNGKHLFTLRSGNPISNSTPWDGTYTEQVVISDNDFTATAQAAYPVAITATNLVVDERLRDIIVERNWLSGPQNGLLYVSDTVAITIRNNIFNLDSASPYPQAIGIGDETAPNSPNDWMNIYNNTIYTEATNNQSYGVLIFSSPPLALTMKNNLLVTPNSSGATLVQGAVGALIQSNNLLSRTSSAVFVNSSPTVAADFALKSGSPAIGAGTQVPVWDDFIRAGRATTWDAGAYQH